MCFFFHCSMYHSLFENFKQNVGAVAKCNSVETITPHTPASRNFSAAGEYFRLLLRTAEN